MHPEFLPYEKNLKLFICYWEHVEDFDIQRFPEAADPERACLDKIPLPFDMFEILHSSVCR